MAIFLKYDGWSGSSTADGYEDQIKLKTLRWSTYRYLEQVDGTKDKRLLAGINVNGLICTKVYDKSSHAILQHMWRREEAKKAEITHVAGSSEESGLEVRKYTLENALVASYDCAEDESGDPIETFTLNFTKIEVKDYNQETDAEKGSSKDAEYDLTKGKS